MDINLPQDMLIEIFLANPSENIFMLIEDKELTLDILERRPRTAFNLYFLWSKGRINTNLYKIILKAIEEGDNALLRRLYYPSQFTNDELLGIGRKAVEYANMEIYHDVIGRRDFTFDDLASAAVQGNQEELLVYLIMAFDNVDIDQIHNLAKLAIKFDHFNILDRMISYGDRRLNDLADVAVECGNKEILMDLIAGIKDKDGNIVRANDFDDFASCAAYLGHKEIVIEMMKMGASDLDQIAESAEDGGYYDIVDYIDVLRY